MLPQHYTCIVSFSRAFSRHGVRGSVTGCNSCWDPDIYFLYSSGKRCRCQFTMSVLAVSGVDINYHLWRAQVWPRTYGTAFSRSHVLSYPFIPILLHTKLNRRYYVIVHRVKYRVIALVSVYPVKKNQWVQLDKYQLLRIGSRPIGISPPVGSVPIISNW